ncbi:MAG TPA: hypothetical protein VHR72_07630 [Gemmataceae bacterium]|jgi:hypothetical protein|nr:hypothetical protein [Gemmataceae bacterium]
MRYRLSAAVLLFAALAAVAPIGPIAPLFGQERNKGTDYPSAYFPLKVGASSVYIGGDGKERSTVSVEKADPIRFSVAGKTDWVIGYALKTTSGDKSLIEDVFVTPDGVYRRSAAGKEIKPPIKILKLPPAAGDSWPVDSESETVHLVGTFGVENATVDLPGRGATPTYLVTAHDFYAGKERIESKTWFAQNLGIVKQWVKVSKFELNLELAGPNTPPPPSPAVKADPKKKAFPSNPPPIIAPAAGSVPTPPTDTLRPRPLPPGLPKLPDIPLPPTK